MLWQETALLLVCDIQKRFRTTIYNFDDVIRTTQKLMKGAAALDIPVIGTEQYPKGTYLPTGTAH